MNLRLIFPICLMGGFALTVGDDEIYFLPTNITPVHYNLLIYTILDGKNFDYWGRVDITIDCNDSTDQIVLNAKGIVILDKEVTVTLASDNGKNPIPIVSQIPEEKNDLYTITVAKSLEKQQKYVVHIPFKSTLEKENNLTGFYRWSYTNAKGETRWMALSQFGTVDTRKVFPVLDQQNLRATFTITVAHTDQYVAVSNMPIATSSTQSDETTQINWVLDEFLESPSLPPNSVAWHIIPRDFKSTEIDTEDVKVKIRIWMREEVSEQVNLAKETAAGGISYFQKFFKVPYPGTKLDIVFVPNMYDPAYGNFGVMLFTEELFLYDQNTTTKYMMFYIVSTTCYEMGDQWTDIFTTPVWWNGLWLTASIPTYLSLRCANQLNSELVAFSDYTIVDKYISALDNDATPGIQPLLRPITDISKIDEYIGDLEYDKGTLTIRLLNLFLSDDVFQKGLAAYLEKYKFSTVTADDLWNALTPAAQEAKRLPEGHTIKSVMDTWSLLPSYPTLEVTRDYDKKSITVKQGKCKEDPKNPGKCWIIPLSLATKSNPKFDDTTPQYWLTGPSITFTIDDLKNDDWVVFNMQMMVPCSFDYDKTNWELIRKALFDDYAQVGVFSRVQLVSDIAASAYSGVQDYKTLFDIFLFVKNDDNYLTWKKVLQLVSGYRTYIHTFDFYKGYREYARSIIEEKFKSFGNINEVPQQYFQLQFKYDIVKDACVFDLGDCRKQCLDIFEKWSKENQPISSDARIHVFCNAIQIGNEEHWNFLLERYSKTTDADEKSDILQSIGCSSNVELLERALEFSLNPKNVRPEDGNLVFRGITDNDIGFPVLKKFLTTRFQDIFNYQEGNEKRIGEYLKVFSNYICLRQDLNDYIQFYESIKEKIPNLESVMRENISYAELTVNWLEKFEKRFREIFLNYNP